MKKIKNTITEASEMRDFDDPTSNRRTTFKTTDAKFSSKHRTPEYFSPLADLAVKKTQNPSLSALASLRFKFLSYLLISLSISSGVSLAEKDIDQEEVLPERVEKFFIRTRSEMNREVPFYLRTPKNYAPGKTHRVLFLCPYLNQDAIEMLGQSQVYFDLADEHGWFILTCTFLQSRSEARNREKSYYYPEKFSGKAVLDALEITQTKYDIDPTRLLMQGLSGGAQFVHRFAMWKPELVTAVAINSSSWFDSPEGNCVQTAWLVIVGESDPAYQASLQVAQELSDVGAAPLFRGFIGMLHEGGGEKVQDLTLEFLKFYHEKTKHQLGKERSTFDPEEERLAMRPGDMPFVGDAQMWTYRENTEGNVIDLSEDSRIFLPSKEIAELWGEYAGGSQ